MILLDCGNSSIKAQSRSKGRVHASFTTSYAADWTRRLQRWMENLPADRCFLASVLDPERQGRLNACLQARFGDDVTRFESAASGGGVTNAYRQPHRLGVDRWLALIGAAGLVDGDCIVIDAGSAITLDLLRGDGRHLGGAILPGMNTSMERFRQIFSHIDFDDPALSNNDEPGCSTETAIQIDYPQRSIDRLRELVIHWKKYLDPETALLLLGGDAPRVRTELGQTGRIVPDLVFQGMYRLAAS